nr:enoyl-CoA hydratase/isomerase family protein [Ramlibacter algicola]
MRYELAGTTAVLTLHRPEQRNALDDALRDALAAAIRRTRDDPQVRAVVLTGAGGHFCGGGDVKTLQAMGDDPDLALATRARMQALHGWFGELVDLEKPVVAAVDGAAFGAGLSLALAADHVIVSPRAKLCAAFGRIGLVPDAAAMYLLPRQVDLARAKDLVFTGRVVEAQEAVAIGLAHRMADDVRDAAIATAVAFSQLPPAATGMAKAIMNRSFESSREQVQAQEALAQAACRTSEAHRAALARALQR